MRSKPKSELQEAREKEKDIEITKLSTGAVFGESDCLQTVGYEFLGDIYAGKEGVDCLVIQQPDLVLAMYERELLRGSLKNQHRELISMIET